MNKLITVPEMIIVERAADLAGHTYPTMMEYAGRGLAGLIEEEYAGIPDRSVLALVGKGNNGGDALVALDYLAAGGWRCTALIVSSREANDPLVRRCETANCEVLNWEDLDLQSLERVIEAHALLLDAIFGTGIKLPLRGRMADLMKNIRDYLSRSVSLPIVIAVDCPSGVDSDNGDVAEEAFRADLTVTMAAVKAGLYQFPAASYVGRLCVVDIGLPPGLLEWEAIDRDIVDHKQVRKILPSRPPDAHKGTFGTSLIIAGSVPYTGAAMLAGRAAYRIGSGLVTLAIPGSLHQTLAGHFVEATWLPLPHKSGFFTRESAAPLLANLNRATAILVGPGLGITQGTQAFLEGILNADRKLPPLVIDADGIKLLAEMENWNAKLPSRSVLTPHPGEMSVLTGMPKEQIQKDRLRTVERYAAAWGHIVVLKGAYTIVAAPSDQTGGQAGVRTALIPVATPALARAGTGDVLAGLITGLISQGVPGYEAAVAAVWIHAHGGLLAERSLGSSAAVLAGDIITGVIAVLEKLNTQSEQEY